MNLWSQIYAPSADSVFDASYNPTGGTDQVVIFNRPSYKAPVQASIQAVSVDGLSNWNFQWSVFDQTTLTYKALIPVTTGGISVIDTLTRSAGYRVEMTRGAESHIYRVWVVFNDLDLHVTNKDADNKLSFGYYNCSSLDLRADTTRIPLFYMNPDDSAVVIINPQYHIRWSTNNPNTSNPSSRLVTRVTDPPYEDTWYILSITDRYGLKRADSVFYVSIQSKAEMTAEYVNLSDSIEYAGKGYGRFYEDDIKSAPGKYRFNVSGSKNMASYDIKYGDGSVFTSDGDTLLAVHEYRKPGTYTAVLTTKSEAPYECIDTIGVDVSLVYADEDNFKIPNIFTPNNDGKNEFSKDLITNNDIFRSQDVSILTLDIVIFNRAGLKVHSYHGNIRDWEGWDGNLRSGAKAPDGVYFYVITTFSAYEDPQKPIDTKIMKGFFHLYREQ